MIDRSIFDTLQGLTTPRGKVIKVEDESGRVLWMAGGGKVILEVEKITSDTYAGETTYTGEQFILLDIYPKTNGTVKVTYGGLTKTITDTSGAAEPNAQQVFFGTFNGVSDEVETPASGRLTIEGDYYAFGCASFAKDSKNSSSYTSIRAVTSLGSVSEIPDYAFSSPNTLVFGSGMASVVIPNSVTSIGKKAFSRCLGFALATFDNPSGWYVTQTEGATSGTAVDVSNPANNATLLKFDSTATETNPGYADYYWYRS